MRIAILKNGIVENVCEADESWALANGGIDAGNAGPGWFYDGKNFTPPPEPVPTLGEFNESILKQIAENDLKIIRALVENDVPKINAHKTAQAVLRSQLK